MKVLTFFVIEPGMSNLADQAEMFGARATRLTSFVVRSINIQDVLCNSDVLEILENYDDVIDDF